jgi:tetratricopeptide (TPR) repeat protein
MGMLRCFGDSSLAEPPEQLAEIEEQLAFEPFNADLHQALGKALLDDGNVDAARTAFERAIVLDPGDPWSHLYLGNVLYGQSAYAEALEEFKQGNQLAPDLPMALICMADAYHGVGEIELADQNYNLAVEVDPDDPIAQRNLSRWREIMRGTVLGEPSGQPDT